MVLVWAVLVGVGLHPATMSRPKSRKTRLNLVGIGGKFIAVNLSLARTLVNQEIP